jgi:type IV secretory pathway VirB3-like protein
MASNLQRRNRVFKALHKPLLLFGIERKLFAGAVILAFMMNTATGSLLFTGITFVIAAICALVITVKDPIFLMSFIKSFSAKLTYDAAKQDPPRMTIE